MVRKHERKPKVSTFRFHLPETLRNKVERELAMEVPAEVPPSHRNEVEEEIGADIPELHPTRDEEIDAQLHDVEFALERKATAEELDEIEARSAAMDALEDLNFYLKQWDEEKKEAVWVRKLENEWDEKMRTERVKIPTGAELQGYLDALDAYAEKLEDDKAIKAESKRSLVKKIRELRREVLTDSLTDQQIEAKIQDFVVSARSQAKAVEKVQVKRLKTKG